MEAPVAVTRDRPAPYAPAKTILDLLTRNRDRGLPSPVTGEVLGRAGIPDSLHPRTLQALQTLDLIDEGGTPTPVLERLRLAPEAEYKARLEEWLRSAYADAFTFVDPSKDDETRVRDAFRSYNPVGQQIRMVGLFLGLCAAAGLRPEKASAPAKPRLRMLPNPAKPAAPRPAQGRPMVKPPAHSARASTSTSTSISTGLPPALAGLLQDLPNGEGWTKAERDKWLATFQVVLDYSIPIVAERKQMEPEDA
jgi:hypothetical protein